MGFWGHPARPTRPSRLAPPLFMPAHFYAKAGHFSSASAHFLPFFLLSARFLGNFRQMGARIGIAMIWAAMMKAHAAAGRAQRQNAPLAEIRGKESRGKAARARRAGFAHLDAGREKPRGRTPGSGWAPQSASSPFSADASRAASILAAFAAAAALWASLAGARHDASFAGHSK